MKGEPDPPGPIGPADIDRRPTTRAAVTGEEASM